MINKIYKTIHNKYSKIFKFIFFLRYLFAIFFVSISLFLTIPMFFNYEKKEEFIKKHLVKSYAFEIIEYENIKYKAFPVPKLELKKVQIKLDGGILNINWREDGVWMTGPTMNVFAGSFSEEFLNSL